MTDRSRSSRTAAVALLLIGQVAAVARQEEREREAADKHERFYGVDRTPHIQLRDKP